MVVPESPILYNNKADLIAPCMTGNTNSMVALVTVHGNKAGAELFLELKPQVERLTLRA